MHPLHRLVVRAAATFVLAALPAFAQDGTLLPSHQLLARLRADSLSLEDAATLTPQLVAQPIAARLQGSDALRAAYLRHDAQHRKAIAEFVKQLAKVVEPPRDKAAQKRGDEAATALRSKALAVSRRDDLAEETIRRDIDPVVAELETLLWPAPATVLEKNPELARVLAALRTERGELAKWFAQYGESAAGLELHPAAEKHFAKVPPPPAPLPVDAFDDELVVWTLLALPLAARDRKVLESNEVLRATSDPQEFAGTTALNRLRWLLGLPLLRIDEKLTLAARDHSQDMATLDFFSHTSPVAGKKTPGDRAARFGTSGGAENIAKGHDSGPSAIRGWWYSPGHHRNMLGNHGRTGLGRSGTLWTQMFGG